MKSKSIDGINSSCNCKISCLKLSEIFVEFFNNREIISIGSGDGSFEYYFNEHIRKISDNNCNKMFITCVESDIYLYNSDIKLYPLFKDVDELILCRPHIINNCQLVIILPDINYLKTIFALRPNKIIILYEVNESIGIDFINEFVNKSDYTNNSLKYESKELIGKGSNSLLTGIDYFIVKSFIRIT